MFFRKKVGKSEKSIKKVENRSKKWKFSNFRKIDLVAAAYRSVYPCAATWASVLAAPVRRVPRGQWAESGGSCVSPAGAAEAEDTMFYCLPTDSDR